MFVAERLDTARALGRAAGDLVNEPDAVADRLREGLAALSDPEYLEGQQLIAPGIGTTLGVRQPLLRAAGQGIRAATRRDPPSTLLRVAERLLREEMLELHWLAYGLLERTMARDPEQTWQLIRAEARGAGDWITIDTLAHVAGRGILLEPYRWAELEQLAYSPSRWERRLVGSTIATIPVVDRVAGRTPAVAARGLGLLTELIGDAAPDVQKALSWALRSMAVVDLAATVATLRREAAIARRTDDGHRAWVVRDALEKIPEPAMTELRDAVAGIRKRPGAPSTSRASAAAAAFTDLGLDVPPADRPITPRP